jgi:hypothetical protein
MRLVNLFIQYLPTITVLVIAVLISLTTWAKLKYRPEYFFWTSLGLSSYLAPLAYIQGFISIQRLIQLLSVVLLMLSLVPKSKLAENPDREAKDMLNSLNITAPLVLILIVHVYIAVRTTYLGQSITLNVLLTPMYLSIGLLRKVSFDFGSRILIGFLGPICLINFFTIGFNQISLQNLVNIQIGGGEKLFGIFKSNHDSAFVAGLLLLCLTYSSISIYRRFLSVIAIVIVLLSGSRGVLIPLMLVFILQFSYLFPNTKKSTKVFGVVLSSLMFLLVFIYILRNDLFARTLTGRTDAWTFYMASIFEDPFFGSGAGVDSFNVEAGLIRRNFNTPHNGYITIASFGGLIVIGLFVLALYWLWQARRRSSVLERTPRVLLFFFILSMITESRLNFQTPTYASYLLVLILSSGYSGQKILPSRNRVNA